MKSKQKQDLWAERGFAAGKTGYKVSTHKVDLRKLKKERKIKSKSGHAGTWATIGLLAYLVTLWFIYVSPIVMSNWFPILMGNVVLAWTIFIRIDKVRGRKSGWEENVAIFQFISIWIIGVLIVDLVFEANWFSQVLGFKEFYTQLAFNMIIVMVILIVNSIVILAYGKKSKAPKVARYVLPTSVLTSCVMLLFFVVQSTYALHLSLGELSINPSDVSLGLGTMIYYAAQVGSNALYGGAVTGAYGGAEMFTAVFEILFYSNTTGLMLAVMVIGTFAAIFTINMTQSTALQSIPTLSVVGIPMVIIISMFLGVIAPPTAFIKIFASDALASFVYTFAMLSVYIIFLSMMMTFTHAAEVFNPGEDD